jgi:DNA-binding MarR family transcriptional regulator
MSDDQSPTPISKLDETVHQRYRLGILAFLSGVERADFTKVRDEVGLTDGNLNRHLALLTEAGYVIISKPVTPGGRRRTWVALSPAGREALNAHVRALRALIDSVPQV